MLALSVSPGCRRAAAPEAVHVAVNPPELSQPAPSDRSLIDEEAVLRLCLRGNPTILSPIFATTAQDKRVRDLVFDAPFAYNGDMNWIVFDAMTESFEESADHLSATIKLRPGLTWHDGAPLTAADVEFSWRQLLDDRVPVKSGRTGPDQLKSCTAVDERTVRFVFKEALPTNRLNMMFGIIPKHLYEAGLTDDPSMAQNDYYNKLNRSPVGNGPYRFVEWVSDDRIVLERWDDYPGERPHFRKIIIRIIPDVHARLIAFERGEIDEVELTAQQFALETGSRKFADIGVVATSPCWQFNYFIWNMNGSNPFFTDRRVRRAMCFATNYSLINELVFHGVFPKSVGPFTEYRDECGVRVDPFSHNPNRAAELIEASGWKLDERDGLRYKSITIDGVAQRVPFSFTMLLPRESESGIKIANVLTEDLRKIGIKMKTQVLEFRSMIALVRRHEFEATYSAFKLGADPDRAWNLWHSSSRENGQNDGGYANPRVDALFEKGRRLFDPQERRCCYAELSKLVYEDAIFTFLVDTPNLFGFNKRLRGLRLTPRGPHLFEPGVRAWWTPKSPTPTSSGSDR